MKKVNRITVVIGRFGIEPESIEIPKGSTVKEALEEAGIALATGEKVYVGGDKATSKDILDDGDVINVVGSKEGGVL